jgi:hypothetical protein
MNDVNHFVLLKIYEQMGRSQTLFTYQVLLHISTFYL